MTPKSDAKTEARARNLLRERASASIGDRRRMLDKAAYAQFRSLLPNLPCTRAGR